LKREGSTRRKFGFFRIRKISTRLTLTTLVIAVVIVASMSIAQFLPNSALFREQIDKELAARTEVIVSHMDEELQLKLAKIETIAKIGKLLGTDVQRQIELISTFTKENPEFTMTFSPDFAGKNAVSDKGEQVDLSNREYIKPLIEGKSVISDPIVSALDQKMIVVFGVPLVQDGKPFGFYSAGYEISKATRTIAEAKIGDTGYAILLDSKGTVVSHPDPSLVMKKNVRDMNISELTAAFESAQKGTATSYSYTYNGIKKIGYSAPTKNGFVVQLSVPENELMAPISDMMRTTVIAAIVVTLAALIATYTFAKRLAKPITYITDAVKVMSAGDFRPRLQVKTHDELGVLATHMNEMLDSLSHTIKQVYEASVSVASSSEEITASTDEVAKGSVDQADRARTMAHLFESLETSIREVASSADLARNLSRETVQIAKEGTGIINRSIDQMEQVNRQMVTLEEDSKRIGEIIEVINDIAEQTNLLALNAAIEAARAGEQGRGFAVVADEVRKLAERSGEATKQIASIIIGMQDNTAKSVHAVGEGVTQFAQTRQSFDGIVAKVNETSNKVGEIAESSVGQASKASDVLMTIESVASVSEEAAAAAEETAAASQELATLAERLNQSVEMFRYK